MERKYIFEIGRKDLLKDLRKNGKKLRQWPILQWVV